MSKKLSIVYGTPIYEFLASRGIYNADTIWTDGEDIYFDSYHNPTGGNSPRMVRRVTKFTPSQESVKESLICLVNEALESLK